MKVVLDTNVITASLATRGLCHSVLELCLDRFEIIISSYLIDEVKINLAKKLKLSDRLIKEIIDFLSENATLIDVEEIPKDICKDPEDARLLALAQKSGASYLITGDKDILLIKKFASSKILSPRQFWETVRKQNET
jgi:putative PIN family toxin of toxin-antitoxin system